MLIDGQPLTTAIIRFFPESGRMCGGQVDEEGRFTLSCIKPGDGAVIGTHRVAVIASEPLGGNKFRWHAPKQYADIATSGLTAQIDGPTEDLKIELSWGKKKGPFIDRM
ncbi:hypothetical protein [Botrimarina hoheduenensis]|uniref:hypothetical protein n=1 Tax=Botrimarina hoheduenensis TaxID=2528000 RepID=UPI0011B430C4|nr:hypothetical protein [Botrimarina hoheduenensis]